LKIVVDEIPEEGGLDAEFSEKEEFVNSFLGGEDGSLVGFASPVKGSFHLQRTGKTVFIDLRIESSLQATCSRCLEDFVSPLHGENHMVLFPEDEAEEDESEELDEKDYYSGEVIDLGEMLAEEAVLLVPYNPVCRKGCRGLCSFCGKNLNSGDCGCARETIDDRFAILKNFKTKK